MRKSGKVWKERKSGGRRRWREKEESERKGKKVEKDGKCWRRKKLEEDGRRWKKKEKLKKR